MNRYVEAGLLADMRKGKRVLVVSESVRFGQYTFRSLAEQVTDDEVVRRANGDERIESPSGGRIEFLSGRSPGFRGRSVDVLFVDCDLTAEQHAELVPCVAASARGEFLRR